MNKKHVFFLFLSFFSWSLTCEYTFYVTLLGLAFPFMLLQFSNINFKKSFKKFPTTYSPITKKTLTVTMVVLFLKRYLISKVL